MNPKFLVGSVYYSSDEGFIQIIDCELMEDWKTKNYFNYTYKNISEDSIFGDKHFDENSRFGRNLQFITEENLSFEELQENYPEYLI